MRNLGIDSAGAYRAGGLKPGLYTVWVRAKTANGFEAAWETVDAFTDVPSLQLTMAPTATIAGRVMTVDGAPLPIEGFRVAAAWTAEGKDLDPIARDQAEVAADGTFEIGGVFGDRTIRVIGLPAGWEIERVAGPQRAAEALRLTPGERVDIIVVIGRTAIVGRVTDPEGQPLANARVTATPVVGTETAGDVAGPRSGTATRCRDTAAHSWSARRHRRRDRAHGDRQARHRPGGPAACQRAGDRNTGRRPGKRGRRRRTAEHHDAQPHVTDGRVRA